MPEGSDDGLTGRIVDTMDEARAAWPEVLKLDRRAVRARFEERFTASRMARDYVGLYQKQLELYAGDSRRPVREARRNVGAIVPMTDLNGNLQHDGRDAKRHVL